MAARHDRWRPEDHLEELAVFRARVADADVVLVRSILEAHEGLSQLTGDGSGWVTLSTPLAQAEELRDVLTDLAKEGHLRLQDAVKP